MKRTLIHSFIAAASLFASLPAWAQDVALPQRVEREQCSARQCRDEGPAELVHEQRDTGRPQREGDEQEHVVLENGTVMDEIDRKNKERSGEHVLREG